MGYSLGVPELSWDGGVSMRCSWGSQNSPERVDYPWDALQEPRSLERVVCPWGETWRSQRLLQKGSMGTWVALKGDKGLGLSIPFSIPRWGI